MRGAVPRVMQLAIRPSRAVGLMLDIKVKSRSGLSLEVIFILQRLSISRLGLSSAITHNIYETRDCVCYCEERDLVFEI